MAVAVSQLCAEYHQYKESKMLPPWVSVRIRTPRFMASKLLRAIVLFLCCCSDLECVLLRQILENQKKLMLSSHKTCSRLHCRLVFRVKLHCFCYQERKLCFLPCLNCLANVNQFVQKNFKAKTSDLC